MMRGEEETDYESLLRLDELLTPVSKGAATEAIEAIPSRKFKKGIYWFYKKINKQEQIMQMNPVEFAYLNMKTRKKLKVCLDACIHFTKSASISGLE
jgi:hypothetical protein